MGISTPIIVAEKSAKVFSNSTGTSVNQLTNEITDLKQQKVDLSREIMALEDGVSNTLSVAFARAELEKYQKLRDDSKREHQQCASDRKCKKTPRFNQTLSNWDKYGASATSWATKWKNRKDSLAQKKSALVSLEVELQKLTSELQGLTGAVVTTDTGDPLTDQATDSAMSSNPVQVSSEKTGLPKGVIYTGIGVVALVGIVVLIKVIKK